MMTDEQRKEKARVHYLKSFGETRGLPMWIDYCHALDAPDAKQEAKEAKAPASEHAPTVGEKRESVLRHFVSQYGEREGTAKWEDYCKKSGLLPSEDKPDEPVDPKPRKRGKGKASG